MHKFFWWAPAFFFFLISQKTSSTRPSIILHIRTANAGRTHIRHSLSVNCVFYQSKYSFESSHHPYSLYCRDGFITKVLDYSTYVWCRKSGPSSIGSLFCRPSYHHQTSHHQTCSCLTNHFMSVPLPPLHKKSKFVPNSEKKATHPYQAWWCTSSLSLLYFFPFLSFPGTTMA